MDPSSRGIILIDGENLVLRYQAMQSKGLKPKSKLLPELIHIPDVFLWHHYMMGMPIRSNVVRCIYYTSAVGDELRLREINTKMRQAQYAHGAERAYVWSAIVPRIFKKGSASRNSKRVDIQICIDALTYAYHGGIDEIFLFTGDADFLPLVEELMRRNIRVHLLAFSDGCSSAIAAAGDTFTIIDDRLFITTESE